MLLELTKSVHYNFDTEKNKVLSSIKTQKKAIIWQQYIGSKIYEYNDQFMNRTRVAESYSRTFHLPGVINILLKDKQSGVLVSKMDSTYIKSIKNEVHKRLLVVLFIENINRII